MVLRGLPGSRTVQADTAAAQAGGLCVIEDRDEEDMYIKVIRKEDLRML